MAKLGDIQKKKVLETAVEGVFIRDLPIAEYETRFKGADEKLEEENHDFILMIFKDIVCDAQGQPFEDLVDATFEDLSNVLSLTTIFDIINSIPKAIVPDGIDLGKLNETGNSK